MRKSGLSIAAGVILIIMAVFNVLGGISGLACAGVAGAAAGMASGAIDQLDDASIKDMPADQRAELDKAKAELGNAMSTGVGGLMAFGAIALIIGVLCIACAIGVFGLKAWAPNITMGTMGLSILVNIVSMVMFGFGLGSVLGIGLAGFVGYAAFASRDTGGPAAPAAPAAPPPAADPPPPAEG